MPGIAGIGTAGIFPSAPIYFEKRDSDDDEGVPHEDRESNSSGPESSHGISGWEHNVARGYEALLEASMHVRSEGADSDPDTRGTEIKYNVRASGSQIACPLEARGFLETAESLLILRSIRPSYKQFSWYPKDASSSPIQEEYLYRIQVSEIDQHLIVSWRPAYSDVYSSDLAEMVKASWTQSMDQVSSRPQAPTLKYITITAIENLQTIEIIKTAQSQISPQSKAYTVFKAPVFEYIIYDELDLWSALLGTSEIYAIQKMLNNYRHTFDDASIESIRVGLVGIESSTDQAKAMILITLERLPGSHLAEPLSAHPRVSIEFEREYVVLTSFIGKRDFDHTHGYRTFTPDLWPGSGWERSRIYGPGSLIPSYNQLQVSWRAVSQGPNLEKVGEGLCVFSISGIEENIVLQTRIETSHEILGDIIYDVWRRKRGQDSLRFITFMNLSSETETILRETYAKKIAKVERENSNSGNRGEPWKPYLTMWASRSSWEAHHLSDETSWSDEAIDSAAMDQLQDARELAAIAHILGNPFRWEGLGSPYIVSVDIGLRLWHGKTSYAMLVRLGSRFLDDEGDVVMAGAGPGMGESDSSDLTASAALADDDEPESDTVLYERERHTNLSIFIDALIIGTELRIKSRIGQQVSSQEGEDAGRAWERQQERYSMAIHSGGDKKPKSFRMPDQAKRLISGIAHQFEQEGVGPSILTTDLLNDESELYNLVYVCNKTNRSQIATSLYVSPQHGHLVILKSPEPDPQPQGVAKYVEIQFSSSLSLAWKGVIVHLPGDAPQPQPIKYITIINLSSWTKNYLRKMKSWYPDRTESVKLDASDSFRAEDSIEGTEFIRGWAHSESHAQNRRSFLVYLGLPEIAAIEEMTWREFRTPVTQARIIEKIRIIWGPEYPHDPQIFISLAEWPPMDLRRTKEADLCARIRGERQDIAKVAGQGMFLAELTAYVAPFAITHGLSMGNWAIAIKDDERIRQRASYLSDAEESLGPTRALQDILPMLNLSVSDINHPIELRGPSLNAEEDGSDRLVLQGLSSPFSREIYQREDGVFWDYDHKTEDLSSPYHLEKRADSDAWKAATARGKELFSQRTESRTRKTDEPPPDIMLDQFYTTTDVGVDRKEEKIGFCPKAIQAFLGKIGSGFVLRTHFKSYRAIEVKLDQEPSASAYLTISQSDSHLIVQWNGPDAGWENREPDYATFEDDYASLMRRFWDDDRKLRLDGDPEASLKYITIADVRNPETMSILKTILPNAEPHETEETVKGQILDTLITGIQLRIDALREEFIAAPDKAPQISIPDEIIKDEGIDYYQVTIAKKDTKYENQIVQGDTHKTPFILELHSTMPSK
ncbi:hypothetical protein Dda_8985 [Drechslerella dactyloides]|uniref:Uncharacterized protein n=1 Tax=Drechslerella dactyloides TaxID=74499 RepID=A0AAD6NFB7_DREDA|nr:hypothetical protein Dda_8985 [Drechslerella dactyloides]